MYLNVLKKDEQGRDGAHAHTCPHAHANCYIAAPYLFKTIIGSVGVTLVDKIT